MNIGQLQKRVAVKAGIALAVVGVLGGVTAGIAMLGASQQQEYTKLKSDLDSTNGQARALSDKIVKAKESLSLYEALHSRGDKAALSLDRDYAGDLLDAMKAQYKLNTLNVTMSPVADEPGGGSTKLISSNVKITVEAFTDELIIAFVNAVKLRFPGYVRIESLTLTRTTDLTRDMLIDVTRGRLASLVRGELSFKWLGVKPSDAPANVPAGAPGQAASQPGGAPPPAGPVRSVPMGGPQ